ncbi:hypothetical protein [Pseudoalteromonas byunsanensis]|uniref:Lipoprotein n=1 Tax=Pseudoalteromonas byunsanensis TaxID=327939 RepID=A0A1S1N039_9GAMM|nr:hypothetical protein [Pseudoalteromonas byunsanensis]OHU94553.1 hypothetical protein BIW53_15950 [Pseudoalteromonas byunsanensis]
MKRILLCVTVVTLTSGCVFVPKEVSYFHERCQIYAKKAVLDSENTTRLASCSGSKCGMYLVGAGVVSAASLVVSGSIVLIQNVVHWQEKNKNCNPLSEQKTNAQPKQDSTTSTQDGEPNELSEIERR